METSNSRYLDWLRYSGVSVIIVVNPLHWRLIPRALREINREWPSPNERTWSVSWLFLTVRGWIDNGAW
jgi:hypothetical protein